MISGGIEVNTPNIRIKFGDNPKVYRTDFQQFSYDIPEIIDTGIYEGTPLNSYFPFYFRSSCNNV